MTNNNENKSFTLVSNSENVSNIINAILEASFNSSSDSVNSSDNLESDRILAIKEALVAAFDSFRSEMDRLHFENETLREENAICREAIECAVDLVGDWSCSPEGEDDGSQGAARATKRMLNEAISKAVPRLMYEKPGGQKMYGLKWREMREDLQRLKSDQENLVSLLRLAQPHCSGVNLEVNGERVDLSSHINNVLSGFVIS